MPHQAEPGGPLLALFIGLFEEDLAAIVSYRGGLVGWRSVLESEFLYLPHDAMVPGALTVSDLDGVVLAQFPRPVWISGLVDGRNRPVTQDQAESFYNLANSQYRSAGMDQSLRMLATSQDPTTQILPWLTGILQK
jgi:hypothetical protein